jgi:hypothetical protein
MGDDDLMQYHAAELLDSHAQLDTIGVPRVSPEGEPLSISQRVSAAVKMYTALVWAGNVMAKAAGRA